MRIPHSIGPAARYSGSYDRSTCSLVKDGCADLGYAVTCALSPTPREGGLLVGIYSGCRQGEPAAPYVALAGYTHPTCQSRSQSFILLPLDVADGFFFFFFGEEADFGACPGRFRFQTFLSGCTRYPRDRIPVPQLDTTTGQALCKHLFIKAL